MACYRCRQAKYAVNQLVYAMIRHMKQFKKGDSIPHWVLSVKPTPKQCIFGADVNVFSDESGVVVQAQKPLESGECLAYVDPSDAPGEHKMSGAPTCWVSTP